MSKDRFFSDLIISYIAIAVGLVLSVVLLVVEYTPPVKASELLSSNCYGEKSFFLPTQLYKEEEQAFSKNAKAFSFLSSTGSWMRVITDVTSRDEIAEYLIVFKNVDSKKIDFSNLAVNLNFDDGIVQELFEDINDEPAGIITVRGERPLSASGFSAELLIGGKNGKCQGKIPNALVFEGDADEPENVGVIKGNQSGEYLFSSGYTPIGFASWRDFKPFTDQGLTILKYDQSDKGWILNPQSEDYFAEPGIGYLVYNPKKESVRVRSDVPFYVPEAVVDHKLSKGWNFIFNDTGNDSFAQNIKLSLGQSKKISLQELINSGKASPKIFFAKDQYAQDENGFKGVDLKESGFKYIIPDTSFFWVYIHDNSVLQTPEKADFKVELKGGGDSYSRGQSIQFEVAVTNQNSFDILLPDGSQQDSCLVGLEFFDKSGQKIESALDIGECPLWPKTVLLKTGESISYNFLWKPDDKVNGEVTVRAYFDYTRMDGSNMLYNETKVLLK